MTACHAVAITTTEGYHTPYVDAPLRIFLYNEFARFDDRR